MSEGRQQRASAWLVGDGPGAMAPGEVATALKAWAASNAAARWPMLWLDATQGLTLLADEGARFADAQALTAWARRVWAHYGSEEGPTVAVPAAAAWRSRSRRAASLTSADVSGWLAAAGQAGQAVACVAPLWSGALVLASQRLPALQRQGRVLVVEGQALTVIDISGGEICGWQLTWLDRADAAALAPWVESAPAGPVAALGHSLPGTPPASLRAPQGLDLAAEAFVGQLPSLAEPSFVPTRPLQARWAWAGAATVALVLAVSVWDAADAWRERERAQVSLQALRTAPATLGRSAPAALGLAPDQNAGVAATARPARSRLASAAGQSQAADAARLAAPWQERFRVAESALPAGGHWLRFEQAAGTGPLRLAGTVATSTAVFEAAQRIAAEPGVLDVTVLRSEVAAVEAVAETAGAGQPGPAPRPPRTRFELSVALAAGGAP
jgi:hypothetical protein